MTSREEGEAVVAAFVGAINRHDLDALTESMTRDHAFVDSAGAVLEGREAVREAWRRYFALFPDYAVEVEQVLSGDDGVALFGVARGTFARSGGSRPEDSWEIPAAWRALVRDGRVAEWSVFADNDPVRRILEPQRDG